MLATAAQLVDYMGGFTPTLTQLAHIENVILPGVQQELEVHCNRPLEVVHIREALQPDDRGYIVFSVTPVWTINSIINTMTGTALTIPEAPDPALPAFVPEVGMRNLDKVGTDPVIGLKHEFFVGRSSLTLTHLVAPYLDTGSQDPSYVADYTGGWRGQQEEGLALAILRVAARETERQFDDTTGIRGGTIDTAQDSDPRLKYWDQDELYEWDRLRRRVII